MTDKASPVGWVVSSILKRPGQLPSTEIFDVTYPDPNEAVEAVKRECGDDPDRTVEAVEQLVATDLGPNKVRAAELHCEN